MINSLKLILILTVCVCVCVCVCTHSVCRDLASGALPKPSRERKWTNMAGIKYNLTTKQKYVRNYVFEQARKMVMKQTNGLYPAPFKIMEVGCFCFFF